MPYCPRCGTQFSEGDRYCIPCGVKLPNAEPSKTDVENFKSDQLPRLVMPLAHDAVSNGIPQLKSSDAPIPKLDWYHGVVQRTAPFKTELNSAKYDLKSFLKIAKRIVGFSESCNECKARKESIDTLLLDLEELHSPSKKKRKDFEKDWFVFLERNKYHLQKTHRLIPEGKNTNYWGTVGFIVGIVLSVVFPGIIIFGKLFRGLLVDIFIIIIMGLSFAIFGVFLDKRAKREGRII